MNGQLKLNDRGYFEARGLNVLAFSNWYDGLFSDAKITGIELIHHGVRTATNGDVRLLPTPGQWDRTPTLVSRQVNAEARRIETVLAYPDDEFQYTIQAEVCDAGVRLSVDLDVPLPQALDGRAGFNLEFLPSAYFGKAYRMDDRSGIFPRYPSGPVATASDGTIVPQPFAAGRAIMFAPEDPQRRVTITATRGELLLFDGRNTAQNGWFVLRSPLPAGTSGRVVEWLLMASTLPDWVRQPVIAHSQVGYHPQQHKVAIIELDQHDQPATSARLLEIMDDGALVERLAGAANTWGSYLRYTYLTFDFTAAREPGLYLLEYNNVRTRPFRIDPQVYDEAWHPTLDVFFPVQMDHMFVREAYRVWHGTPHLDDALQAPVDHDHFDLYAQGSTTDTPYQPGEHIPGLNIGGWFDAGDFDIRTQTQYATLLDLVHTWELFRPERDQTAVDQEHRSVQIHVPDGAPDVLQQIEHGTLALIAQHRAVGHAIHGIIEPNLVQYVHLGDAASKTDNRVYNSALNVGESDGFTSGTFDDRWAFTSRSTPLNYGSIAALAAASRALRGYNDALADECFETAQRVWDEEHSHAPDLFHHGNTTGGELDDEELKAALELLLCTKQPHYAQRIEALWPAIERNFALNASVAVRALPYMSQAFAAELRARVQAYREYLARLCTENPFGVPISTGGWAGNGQIIHFAATNYALHTAFPDLIDVEAVLCGLNYIYGCHPGSDISFVSGVGAASKEVAYGNNRADFSFIAGGIVPGVLIVKPDFPENKEDWPFFWGQNEYVVDVGAAYLYLVHAAIELLNRAA